MNKNLSQLMPSNHFLNDLILNYLYLSFPLPGVS